MVIIYIYFFINICVLVFLIQIDKEGYLDECEETQWFYDSIGEENAKTIIYLIAIFLGVIFLVSSLFDKEENDEY